MSMAAHPRRVRRSSGSSTTVWLWVIASASAVAAAFSPAAPVGLDAADAFWCGALGLALPLVASRARRWPLIWMAAVAAVAAIGGDLDAVLLVVALLVLLGFMVFSERRSRIFAAAMAAVALQALLRGPSYGFLGLPTLVGAAAFIPMCWSAYRMAHRRERRIAVVIVGSVTLVCVVLGIAAMIGTLNQRATLEDAADLARAGLDSVRSADSAGATERFDAAAGEFQEASASLEGWSTWGGRFVPIVGQHVEAVRRVASSGVDLSESASTTVSSADYSALTADGGRVDLAEVTTLQDPVGDAASQIEAALRSAEDVSSPWLIQPLAEQVDRFTEQLTDANDQAGIAADALDVAPALLGGDGPRRYFVAFGTPGEARNGGGFVGAYGILVAEAGQLRLEQSGNLNALNPTTDSYLFEPPPDWEERYGSLYVDRFLGNIAASPSWPTDRDVIQQLYPQTPGGTDVDGAIYVDPAAVAGLLQLTGPVPLPEFGVTLDSSNAERFLLQDQYVLIDGFNPLRKEILGDAARATFDALVTRDLPPITELSDTLGGLVAGGHLRVSVSDPSGEAFLDRVGLSGRWTTEPGTDHLSVRWANLLSNKIDSFIQRDIEVISTVDRGDGTVEQKITVVVRNEAPPGGLPSYLIGNDDALPEGTSRDMLGVYTNHLMVSATVDGQPAESGTQFELGTLVHQVVVEVPPGGRRTVVFQLSGVLSGWPYRLEVTPQPMANEDLLTLRMNSEDAPRYSGPLDQPVVIGR